MFHYQSCDKLPCWIQPPRFELLVVVRCYMSKLECDATTQHKDDNLEFEN